MIYRLVQSFTNYIYRREFNGVVSIGMRVMEYRNPPFW